MPAPSTAGSTRLNLCGGYYQQGAVIVQDDHGAGDSSVLDAFAYSSNIGAFRMAQQLGPARFHGVIKAFGFGDRTGIELPNEAPGRVRRHTDWEVTSLPHIAYGYEVSVTPLQLIAAYDAVLNDGMLRRPRLIDAVLDERGNVVDPRPPVDVRRVCSRDAARAMRTAMLETVRKGTARKAALPGFEVGGKTGSALRYEPRLRGYAADACNLSFFGFIKSQDRIELAVLVVVQDPEVPREQEFAGTICGPVFRRIAARVLAHRGVEPAAERIENAELAAGR
jgi:cell division protein FtsI (penicillin-binding protein 3)